MRLATRRSLNTVQGVIPALRRRLPSSEISVPSKPKMQGSWKIPVGENFDWTTAFPNRAVHAGVSNVFGLPVSEDNCRLSPLPVMILNGRPELNSTRGANVQSLKTLLTKPLPESLPVWYTPLNTKR